MFQAEGSAQADACNVSKPVVSQNEYAWKDERLEGLGKALNAIPKNLDFFWRAVGSL